MRSEGFPFIVWGSGGWTLVRLEWLVASSSGRRRVVVASLIPCLWGKLQNLSFSKVSKQVVISFCVAGVALCHIPTCLITCRKCQNWRKSRTKCSFCCAQVSRLESSGFPVAISQRADEVQTWITGGINLLEKQGEIRSIRSRCDICQFDMVTTVTTLITTQIASTRSFTSPSPCQDRIMDGWTIHLAVCRYPNPCPVTDPVSPEYNIQPLNQVIAPAFWVILGESLWISSLSSRSLVHQSTEPWNRKLRCGKPENPPWM